ncbi:hypothetical protein DAPPUDRAFT_113437 [Daphnia pulex]|uniref:CCHC-type domain-containing protein n=1 Tax=Daphnia pulex TaxID=6669 RepID=E9HF10_DAPPU|nr:hypothetical protein DAPPUDRAFT_113437 [Daphnia pulex]|eukprot:EFX69689.1 hypothetical protein DAPPUDRAFT_113437 [Daphnia pulex]
MRYDSFEIGFGNPFPRLQLLSVHHFVKGLGLSESKILVIAPVLLVGDQVVRVTLFKTADVTAILNQHGGARQHRIEGRQINVLIKDPNVEERFVRVFDYPANANMEVMKVRLREFGTVLDLRRDRYAGATAGMIPCLTGQLTVRMTLNYPIPSYLQVGEHKVYIRYANQPVTCRECNLPGHMALDCPARKNRLLPAPPKIVPQKTNGGKEKSMAAALQSASRPPSTPTEFPPLPDRSWTEVSRRKKNQNKTEGDETEFTLITTDTTYVTDHAVLHAACSILPVIPTPRPPRPSIWKLNTKILSEDAFRRQLTTFIRHAAALPLKSVNVVTWWDSVFKPGVKRIAQSYCRRRASLVKEMGQFYQNCLAEITDPTTELDWPTFQALREEAREWHLRALMGAKIRSRSVTDSDIDSPSWEQSGIWDLGSGSNQRHPH